MTYLLRLQGRRARPHNGRERQQRHVDQIQPLAVLPHDPVVLAVQQAERGDAHGQGVHARQGGVGHRLGGEGGDIVVQSGREQMWQRLAVV